MTNYQRRHAPPADPDDRQPTLDERMAAVWPGDDADTRLDNLRGLTAGCWMALRKVAREEDDR